MAYAAALASALSGASPSQLAHWRHTDLMAAEYSTHTRVFYSYRDLVALRTFVYLRTTTPLQRIRKAVSRLREIGELEHLSAYKLVAVGKGITLIREDESAMELVVTPQEELLAHMADVLGEFTTMDGRRVLNLNRPMQDVVVEPGLRQGLPVVENTRIGVELVAGLVEDGVSPEDVRFYYPTVSPRAAQSATDFMRWVHGTGGGASVA